MVPGNLRDFRLSNLWKISLPSLLRYEDRNSMAFSVEARLPYLDHRVVEFIFSIPFDYLIRKGWTKFVLRESMKGRIPDDIRLRKGKLGFTVPQRKWYGEMKPVMLDSFSNDFRTGKFVDRHKIIGMISSGTYNEKFLHRAFNLERWMRVFNL
jgi:asparagine synthase (glutamine-hydrolysing)